MIQTKTKVEYAKALKERADYTKELRIELMADSSSFNSKFFDIVLEEEEYLIRELDNILPVSVAYLDSLDTLETKNSFIQSAYNLSVIISILFMVFGFYFWYKKYQKFIDLDLKLKGLENKIKYETLEKKQSSKLKEDLNK